MFHIVEMCRTTRTDLFIIGNAITFSTFWRENFQDFVFIKMGIFPDKNISTDLTTFPFMYIFPGKL